jgi:GT2 family glycosyltransferase
MIIPVTVVVLSYNRLSLLKDAVESVKNQTHKPFELIILDNGSTDQTSNYFRNQPGIIFIQNEQNIGAAASYKKAFSLGSCPHVLVFHDDDIMAVNTLEVLFSKIKTDQNLVFVGSLVNFATEPRKSFIEPEKDWAMISHPSDFANFVWQGNPLGFCTVLYKRKTVDVSFLDTDRFGKFCDRPFLGELTTLGPAMITYSKLVDYRIHENQDSQKAEQLDYLENLQRYLIETIKKRPKPASFYYFFEERLAGLPKIRKEQIRKEFGPLERAVFCVLMSMRKRISFMKKNFQTVKSALKK